MTSGYTPSPDWTAAESGERAAASDGAWAAVADSGNVIDVAVMKDGTILGVGMNYALFTRADLTSPWQNAAPGNVSSVTVMPDGTILGVGINLGKDPFAKNHTLFTMADLNHVWQSVPDSGEVKDVAAMPDGTIIGVGMDDTLYTRADLTSRWESVANSGFVIGVASGVSLWA